MRTITKLFGLLLIFSTVFAVTSCKDYDEDNYNELRAQDATLQELINTKTSDLQSQINALKTQIGNIKSCTCIDLSGQVNDLITAVNGLSSKYATVQDLVKANARIDSLAAAAQALGQSALDQANLAYQLAQKDSSDIVTLNNSFSDLTKIVNHLDSVQQTVASEAIYAVTLAKNDSAQIVALKDSLSSYYTKDEVDAMIANLHKCNCEATLKAANAYSDTLVVKTADYLIALMKDKDDILYSDLQNAYVYADSLLQNQINDLKTRVEALETALAAITSSFKSLEKEVSGIVIQQLYCPAIGAINTPLGINTNILMTYYGDNLNGDLAIDGFPYASDVDAVYWPESETLVGNPGKIYYTINPSNVNFVGQTPVLVNSQDQACGMTLSPAVRSDKTLKFGITRAETNNFYESNVTLPTSAVENDNLHINIDKSEMKDAARNVLQDLRDIDRDNLKSTLKTSMKDIVKQVAKASYDAVSALSLDAWGLKYTWTDSIARDRSVTSDYSIAAVAVKPLTFNTMTNTSYFPRADFWGHTKAVNFIDKIHDKVVDKIKDQLDPINANIDDLMDKLDIRIDSVNYDKDINLPRVKVHIVTDGSMYLCRQGGEIFKSDGTTLNNDYVYVLCTEGMGTQYTTKEGIKCYEIAGFKVHDAEKVAENDYELYYEISTSDIKEAIQYAITKVNGSLSDVESQIGDIVDSANEIISQLRDIEHKIEGDSYMTRIYNYLDDVYDYTTRAWNKIPSLAYPTLLINSDAGLSKCGYKGAPSDAKGEVQLFPTSNSLEYVVPIFKKYVRVTKANGAVVFAGQIVEGSEVKLGTLAAGTYNVAYYALDYAGTQMGSSNYQFIVK